MTEKDHRPLHKKTFPYIMLFIGLLFGLGIAIDWDIKISGMWDVSFKAKLETKKSGWDIAASIGSLLAGLGTVGLLAFGWFKGNEWIRQVKASKRLDLISETIKELSLNSYEFYKFIRMNSRGESRSLKLLRLADTKAKLDFNIKTSVIFSANALNPDMSFPQFLVHIERQLDILGVCLNTLICFVLQDDPSYKHLDHCRKKLRNINGKLNELKANQHLSEDISDFFDEILFLNLDTGKLYRSLVDNEIK